MYHEIFNDNNLVRLENNFLNINSISKKREKVPFNPVNKVFYSRENNISFGPYSSNLSIKYCIDGMERYWIDGKLVQLKAGEYIIIKTGSEVFYESICVHKGVSIFLDSTINTNKLILNTSFSDSEHFGIWLRKTFEAKDRFDGGLLEHLNNNIEKVHLDLQKKLQKISRVKYESKIEITRSILKGAKYITQNYMFSFDLEEIANQACMSKFHFSRFFKEFYGTSPWEFFQEVRMMQAAKLIKSNKHRLVDIARLLGFSQLSAFSRSFNQYFDISPTAYKVRHTSNFDL